MPVKDLSRIVNLQVRAEWLAWRYELDKERILKVLERVDVNIESTVMGDFFAYLSFDPSLEDALFYLRPQVALKFFETADLADIRKWLQLTESLLRRQVNEHWWLEEQCWWEAEKTLFPG
ncbi:MAG: hypothetical protein ABIK83_06725 [Candidatus Zixiibacteriota bacterium]